MIAFLLLMFFPFSAQADHDCNNLHISSYSQSTVNFNSDSDPAITVTVQRSGKKGCDFFLTFDYGPGGSASGRKLYQSSYSLPMNIYKDSAHTQVVKEIPDANTTAEAITGSFPDDTSTPSSQTITFYPQLGSVTYNRFGYYSASFRGRLYEGTPSNHDSEEDHENLTFIYNMAKKIDLSLVPTGASFNAADTAETLNFGTLSAGAQRSFDILVKYNAGYLVRLSSVNEGRLKHQSYSDTVPYTFAVNSTPVSLSGSDTFPAFVAWGWGVSPANGLVLSSSVTIGALGNVRAGSYSDTVTVTVQSIE
jgi:spore coat protein U-like protein